MSLTVELLYGFSSISWTEEPRDSIVNNGYELYKAGHIFKTVENETTIEEGRLSHSLKNMYLSNKII